MSQLCFIIRVDLVTPGLRESGWRFLFSYLQQVERTQRFNQFDANLVSTSSAPLPFNPSSCTERRPCRRSCPRRCRRRSRKRRRRPKRLGAGFNRKSSAWVMAQKLVLDSFLILSLVEVLILRYLISWNSINSFYWIVSLACSRPSSWPPGWWRSCHRRCGQTCTWTLSPCIRRLGNNLTNVIFLNWY